jgi:hypothetical protein
MALREAPFWLRGGPGPTPTDACVRCVFAQHLLSNKDHVEGEHAAVLALITGDHSVFKFDAGGLLLGAQARDGRFDMQVLQALALLYLSPELEQHCKSVLEEATASTQGHAQRLHDALALRRRLWSHLVFCGKPLKTKRAPRAPRKANASSCATRGQATLPLLRVPIEATNQTSALDILRRVAQYHKYFPASPKQASTLPAVPHEMHPSTNAGPAQNVRSQPTQLAPAYVTSAGTHVSWRRAHCAAA